MKTIHYIFIAVFFVSVFFLSAESASGFCSLDAKPNQDCFQMTQKKNIYDSKHLRVFNGYITLGSDPKENLNFRNPISPPLATNDFEFTMKVDGKIKIPIYTSWLINDFDRQSESYGVVLRTTLTLAPAEPVFLALGQFYEREGKDREFELSFEMKGKMGKPDPVEWDLDGPEVTTPVTSAFDSDKKIFSATVPDGGIFCKTELPDPVFESGILKSKIIVPATTSVYFYFICAMAEKKEAKALLAQYDDPAVFVKDSRARRMIDINEMSKWVPHIITNNRNLRTFFDHSMLSIKAARWGNDDAFIFTPFFAGSGLDGRAMSAQLWDYSYVGPLMIMADRAAARKQIRYFVNMNINRHRAFDPLTARGLGKRLAFSDYAIVRLVRDYVALTGDWEILTDRVLGKPMIDNIIDIANRGLRTLDMPKLLDYGDTQQLLGVRKAPYEHVVPSPNAERVVIFRTAADMLDLLQRRESEAAILRKKADFLEKLINEKMWNPEKGWYDVIDPAGEKHTVWSVQIYHLLDTGVPSKEQSDKMVLHLNDSEFLYPYGVHSLSKKDAGFDDDDIAWGGPGTFIGEAPELITNLYRAGYPELGEDILTRILWWGNRFPYYPEAVRADQMEFDESGRSNTIAGAAAAQAIIYGVFGLEVSMRGDVSIKPVPLNFVKKLELQGLKVRYIRIDLKMKADVCEVYVNKQKVLDAPIGKRTTIITGSDIVFPDPTEGPCYDPDTIRKNVRKEMQK